MAETAKKVAPKKYRSVSKKFAFRVGPADKDWDPESGDTKGNGLIYFQLDKDTVVADPKHQAICDTYVPRVLFDVSTPELREKEQSARADEAAKQAAAKK